MGPLELLILNAVIFAVGMYVLYRVVRAAVRDGIRDARPSAEADPLA